MLVCQSAERRKEEELLRLVLDVVPIEAVPMKSIIQSAKAIAPNDSNVSWLAVQLALNTLILGGAIGTVGLNTISLAGAIASSSPRKFFNKLKRKTASFNFALKGSGFFVMVLLFSSHVNK